MSIETVGPLVVPWAIHQKVRSGGGWDVGVLPVPQITREETQTEERLVIQSYGVTNLSSVCVSHQESFSLGFRTWTLSFTFRLGGWGSLSFFLVFEFLLSTFSQDLVCELLT